MKRSVTKVHARLREKVLLSVEEAAAVMDLGRDAAWALVHAGTLPTIRLGRRYLVPRESIESFARQAHESQRQVGAS